MKKKQLKSVLIGTPTYGGLFPEYVTSLTGTIKYLNGKASGKLLIFRSPLVSAARNYIASKCEEDYLMFIDSDIYFPPGGIIKLMEADKDIVGGLYYGKSVPNKPIVYYINDNNRFVNIPKPPKQLFQCDGIGTGFMLIKRKVLKAMLKKDLVAKIGWPFNMRQKEDGTEEGEDLAFCRRAKFVGFEVWCDPTIKLGHIGQEIFDERHYEANLTLGLDSIEYTNEIEGWMSEGELNWLYKRAKTMTSVIEIGSWKGKSTHALLSACKGQVTAIDHFKGSDGEEAHKGVKNIYKEFLGNVGKFKNLKVLKMTSDKAVKKVEKGDMVFIDGAHTYEQVKKDIQNYLPYAKKLICGHDYNWTSVKQAVDETLGEVKTADSIWFKETVPAKKIC